MKKHTLLLLILLLNLCASYGQKDIVPANELKIEGRIKAGLTYTLEELSKLTAVPVKDFEITNHKGETKGSVRNLKGIPLKHIFKPVEFAVENPKDLNKFYLVFTATDNYQVVFSWNEIFNTEVGDNVYIITEKEGKKTGEMEERILLVSTADLKIGRRYIKGLSKITVNRID